MKALTLEETGLKEELKRQYYEKEKDKFKMLCHLEDFEVQYWELLKKNKQLKKVIYKATKFINCINGGKICNEFNPYLDDLLNMLNEVSE